MSLSSEDDYKSYHKSDDDYIYSKTDNKNKKNKIILNEDGKIKEFNKISTSTMTVIASTNLNIDLDKFFIFMPVTDFKPVEKKRGRHRKIYIDTNTTKIPYGSIVSIQKKTKIRGAILKPKKEKNENSEKYFLHSVTVVIILENLKEINIKISSNGKFQITGCKTKRHYIDSIIYIYKLMKITQEWTNETLFKYTNNISNIYDTNSSSSTNQEYLDVVFEIVMQNRDFYLGFLISRTELDIYINNNTNYTSIFEGSMGTGVNLKINKSIKTDEKLARIQYFYNRDTIEESTVDFKTYFDTFDNKDKEKFLNKQKYHTFLIFASGKVIYSSTGSEMEQVFYNVLDILLNQRDKFEDKAKISSYSIGSYKKKNKKNKEESEDESEEESLIVYEK